MDTIDLFALSLIKDRGRKAIKELIRSKMDVRAFGQLDEQGLGRLIENTEEPGKMLEAINQFSIYREVAEEQLQEFRNRQIHVISYWDAEYPDLLRSLKDAPPLLYLRGNISLLNHRRNVAIIGSRRCTKFGYQIAFDTAELFAARGWNIVSGLALGIDTAGHEGALEAGGKTTAVLLDVANIYPAQNRILAEKILQNGGLLIAENAPGVAFMKWLLLTRDRLQSGMSLAVVAVESDLEGGTMNTVGHAIRQNRLVYCPQLTQINGYPEGSTKSRGINMLLREGKARPFESGSYQKIFREIVDRERELDGHTTETNAQRYKAVA